MQVAAECSGSDVAFPGTGIVQFGLQFQRVFHLFLFGGIWESSTSTLAPGRVRGSAPGRMDGRQGELQVTEPVPHLGRKMNDLGRSSCPLHASSQQRLHLPSCTAEVSWNSAGRTPGGCVTAGQGSLSASAPVLHPCPGSCVPARTRTGFPELNHNLKLSPSAHRAGSEPVSSRALEKPGKERWRGCLR